MSGLCQTGGVAKKIPVAEWQAALATVLDGDAERNAVATAVRGLLQDLAARYPGNAVEVRVPPYGAVQCVEGPGHTRGTPPNVVELQADAFLELAVGRAGWEALRQAGRISASGARSDIGGLFPLLARSEIERIQMNHQAE